MGEGRFELADTHDVFEIAILYEYDRERGVHDIDIREAREEITISPNRSNYLSKSPHVQKIVRKFFKHHGILPNDSEEVRRGA